MPDAELTPSVRRAVTRRIFWAAFWLAVALVAVKAYYIFDLRDGVDELYDLDRDPNEQHNLAKAEPERCARMRQRLAAWTEANRRQYERADEQRIPTLSAVHPY